MTDQPPLKSVSAASGHDRAAILSDALPFMQQYHDKTVVIKYGGNAIGNGELAHQFAHDVVLLKQSGVNPVVVHGGGPQIGAMLAKHNIKSEFQDGLRITGKASIGIVERVLTDTINKQITAALTAAGGQAVGLSGKHSGLMIAKKLTRTAQDPDSNIEKVLDLGFVGEPETVNPAVIEAYLGTPTIPVIAPIAASRAGETYNINADTFAGALAGALKATRFLMLTDVRGVLDKDKDLIEELDTKQAQNLIKDKTITGGMIPKVENCLAAVDQGVAAAVILDGRVPHAILLELFTPHGVGTLIAKKL